MYTPSKKTGIILSLVFATTLIVYFANKTNTDPGNRESEDEEMEHKRSKKPAETGVDKQLSRWFQARAYPDPYYLNKKFAAAWEHAKAMRTPNSHSGRTNDQSRLNFGGWNVIQGPTVGRVLSIAINPSSTSTVFIGTASGGIWKTTNGGTSWSFVPTTHPVLGVPTIVFHPSNSNIILAGTGEVYRVDTSNVGYNIWKGRGTYGAGILRSTDGGVNWTQVMNKNMSEMFGIQMIKFDPTDPNIVYACTTHGLYKSTDAGATWGAAPLLTKVYVSDVVINSSNNQQMMAAIGNLVNSDKGIYRSTDGGANWTKIVSAAIPTSFMGFSRFAYLSGNTVYISMGRSDGGTSENELMRSTDFGATWTSQNGSHHCQYQYWFANTAAILPSRPDSIFMGGVNFYRHRVSAQTRTTIGGSMHSDYHDIKFDPTNSDVAYIANDGGVYKTTNATAASPTFTEINTGLNIAQFYASLGVSATTANLYIGGLQDNGVWYYNGTSWSKPLGGDGGPCVIDPTNNNIVYASNDARRVNKSTGGVGGSYSTSLSSWAFSGDDRTGFMAPVAISRSTPTTLYVASDNLHKTTNSGTSWTNNNGTISANTNYIEAQYKTGIALAVSATDANKLYVSLSNMSQRTDDALNVVGSPSVFKSTNGGTSFTNITAGLPSRFVLDFAISPTNDDSVFVALGGYGSSHIYVSGNGGSTWANAGIGLPDVPFNALIFDPLDKNIIYAGSDLGVYVSPDRGNSWYDFNTGMADNDPVMVFDLQVSADNKIVAATHGRGIFRSDPFNPSTLPVTILSFTGVHERGVIKLQWRTEQESNLKQYELEKSINGSSFEKIATITARNQATAVTYSYSDPVNSNVTANYYYRLKIVELDGTFKYFTVVLIKVNSNKTFIVKQNPVRDQIPVQIKLAERGPVNLSVYDLKGRKLLQRNYNGNAGDNYFVITDIQSFPTGIYLLEAIIDRQRFAEKILKQ